MAFFGIDAYSVAESDLVDILKMSGSQKQVCNLLVS